MIHRTLFFLFCFFVCVFITNVLGKVFPLGHAALKLFSA